MKMKRMFISVVVTVFTILISSIFVGNVSAQEQLEDHLFVKNQAFVNKDAQLRFLLAQIVSRSEKIFTQVQMLHNLEDYYVFQKEHEMPINPVYIVSFFEIAQEIERTADDIYMKDRYEIAKTQCFDDMQEDLIKAYEKCVATKMKNPTNLRFYYHHNVEYYRHRRWEQALDAFSGAMQPEALMHFNKLKEQMHQE